MYANIILLMNHGIQKWSNFQELSTAFPDPLGIGSPLSLGLAIFGELVCSMAFIIGMNHKESYRHCENHRNHCQPILEANDKSH